MLAVLAAHPRSRGENLPATITFPSASGSSPLARGKLRPFWVLVIRERLIPARAGKTLRRAWKTCNLPAHPRSRGENDWTEPIMLVMPGSSPLARGKQAREGRIHIEVRLIPARAGKTPSLPHWPAPRAAHPRSRGENPGFFRRCASGEGSSPLARGKLIVRSSQHHGWRLIPARAGKTS